MNKFERNLACPSLVLPPRFAHEKHHLETLKSSIPTPILLLHVALLNGRPSSRLHCVLLQPQDQLAVQKWGEMSPESYSTEARSLLADFLISSLRQPEHWYAPMLPPEHPSSLSNLAGWTLEERNHVLEAAGFVVKRGTKQVICFKNKVFDVFLSEHPQLQSIERQKNAPKKLRPKDYWAYLIGVPSGDARVQSFSSQINSDALPPPVHENNKHRVALKEFAKKLVESHKNDSGGGNGANGDGSAHSNGAGDSRISSAPNTNNVQSSSADGSATITPNALSVPEGNSLTNIAATTAAMANSSTSGDTNQKASVEGRAKRSLEFTPLDGYEGLPGRSLPSPNAMESHTIHYKRGACHFQKETWLSCFVASILSGDDGITRIVVPGFCIQNCHHQAPVAVSVLLRDPLSGQDGFLIYFSPILQQVLLTLLTRTSG